MKAESKIERLARHWWLLKRPVEWTEDEHLENPEVNCPTPIEQDIAVAVAERLRKQREEEGRV